MKKIFAIVFALVMFVCNAAQAYAPDGHVYITTLDVGQGDATLIETPAQNVLIDTGDVGTRTKLVSMLQTLGVDHIERVILTHPHADHIGGVAAVLENFPVDEICDNGIKSPSPLYKNYRAADVKFTNLKCGDVLDLGGGVKLRILHPNPVNFSRNQNDNSIVGKLTFGDFAMLFMGDAEADTERNLCETFHAALKSNILKVGHHGSKTSTTSEFLGDVAPDFAIISAGRNNSFGHPHKETLSTLRENFVLPTNILCTRFNGSIRVESDGKNFFVIAEDAADWVVDYSGEIVTVTRLD